MVKTSEKIIEAIAWDAAGIDERSQALARVLSKMNQAEIEKLLQASGPEDQIKIKVLYNAVVKGIQDYNTDPTAAKLKDWKSAEKELEEFTRSLKEKFHPSERTFSNLRAVLKYLTDCGYKIGQSKIYEDCADGRIRPNKQGAYTLKEVKKYAATLKRLDGSGNDDQEDNQQKERNEAETRKAKAQAEHWELKTKIAAGQYVPKDAFERELAARASTFRTDLENFCRSQAVAIIGMLAQGIGEKAPEVTDEIKQKAPELVDFMLAAVETFLNRYSEGAQFEAMIELPEEPEEERTDEDDDD